MLEIRGLELASGRLTTKVHEHRMCADLKQGRNVTLHTSLRTESSEGAFSPVHQAKGKWEPCEKCTIQNSS